MRKYECTYLVSDEVQESDLNKVTGKIAGFVNDLGGKIEKEDIWGRRKLAYPIKKQDFATYITLYFEMPANKMIEFERDVRLTTAILRHLVTVKDFGKEEMTLTAAEIAETAEIEKAVGGEKSFEAVLGETEESKKLMAVREEKESAETTPETEETREEETPKPEEKPEVSKEKKEIKKKPTAKKAKVEKAEESKEEKAPAKKKAAPKKKEDEAERLSKLNEELDDILKDEL